MPPYVAMADARDEMPPGVARHDAEQSEAARNIGKSKAPSTPREDQILQELASVLKESKEVMVRVAAAVEEASSAAAQRVAIANAYVLTFARMMDCEKGLQSAELKRAQKDLVKVRASGEELQDARKALIVDFLKYRMISKESSVIGIKTMGKLEEAPFKYACMRKYGNEDDLVDKTSAVLSVWQDKLKNPSWRPFKTVEVDGKTQVLVDEDDAKLRQLKNEYDYRVYSAVKESVAELREYNPAEGYPVPELWNFEERRKATAVEALNCVFDYLKKY